MGIDAGKSDSLSVAGTACSGWENRGASLERRQSRLIRWGKLGGKTAGLGRQTRSEGSSPVVNSGSDPLGGSGDGTGHRTAEAGGRTSHRRHPFRGVLISTGRHRSASLFALERQPQPGSDCRISQSTYAACAKHGFDATTVRQGAYAKNFATNSNCRNSVVAQEILRFVCHSSFFCGASPAQPAVVRMIRVCRAEIAALCGVSLCKNSRPGDAQS